MKKYYWTKIYQVSKSVGYIKAGEKYGTMTTYKEKDVPYAVYTLTISEQRIMVEEILPFLAREVKTGVLFPIVCLHQASPSKITYQSYPFRPIHTFVASTKDKTGITRTQIVQTPNELEKYNSMFPDVNKLNQDLLNIIEIGKSNMLNKFESEKEQIRYERRKLESKKQQLNEQKQEKRNERLKVRKLARQFKQERKCIK